MSDDVGDGVVYDGVCDGDRTVMATVTVNQQARRVTRRVRGNVEKEQYGETAGSEFRMRLAAVCESVDCLPCRIYRCR